MSQIDIYTDLVLRTAQFSGPLKTADEALKRVVNEWSNTTIAIATSFTLPDTTAVRQVIGQLRAESIEIPVRYVVQGQPPSGPPSPTPSMPPAPMTSHTAAPTGTPGTPSVPQMPTAPPALPRSNLSTTTGASIAMSNGRPGVDPQGLAGSLASASRFDPVAAAAEHTVETSDLGTAIDAFRSSVGDLRDEIADLARQFEAWSQSNRGNPRRDDDQSSARQRPSSAPQSAPDAAPTQREPTTRARRRQAARDAQTARNRGIADEIDERVNNERANTNGGGFDGSPPSGGERRGGGHGGQGRGQGRGLGSFINSHPSLSRLFGGLGVAYELSNLAQAATSYGDSTYIPTGNVASLATRQISQRQDAIRNGIESVIPVFGRMATNAADFAGAGLNWAMGNGFVTEGTRRQYKAQQEDLASESKFDVARSAMQVNSIKTYDPRKLAVNASIERKIGIEEKLTDAKYRDRTDPSRLNESGQKIKAAADAKDAAQYDRDRREADFAVAGRNADAEGQRQSAARRFDVYDAQSRNEFGRDAQLDNATGQIDDRILKRRRDVSNIADPEEKTRQERVLSAEEGEAEAEKAAKTHELKKQWAIEDAGIIASTQAATQQASGDYYDADRTEFKAAWDAKIKMEQDGGKRVLMERQRVAEETARNYKLVEQARHNNIGTQSGELRTAGRSRDAARSDIANEAVEEGAAQGLFDLQTRKWADPTKLNHEQNILMDSIDRKKRSKLAALDKQERYGNEDINREAEANEDRFGGNNYGGRKQQREAETKRQLEEVKDTDPRSEDTRAAIKRRAKSEQDQEDRDHSDAIRRTKLQQQQADLRIQGRGQLADALGDRVAASEEIRSVRGDKDLLPATLARLKSEMEEKLVGSQRSETFGSVAEYAQRNFQQAANQDQGAQAQLQGTIKELGDVLAGPASALQQAADKMIEKLGTI